LTLKRQGLLEVGPQFSKVLPSSLQQIHDHALKEQHGDEILRELADLEAGIKVAEGTITAAREEIAFDVGGTAKFDEAAKPYGRLSESVWLKTHRRDDRDVVQMMQARQDMAKAKAQQRLQLAVKISAGAGKATCVGEAIGATDGERDDDVDTF
jgi:hypothetical protein